MKTDVLPPFAPNAWLRFDAIRHAVATAHPRSVLEIGPGQGAFAMWVSRKADYVGVEHDATSREATRERLAQLGRGTVVANLDELSGRQFDLVCAFEVLEHIEDDAGALAEWRSRLVPGGYVLLSVPGHAARYGPHDELAGHLRRYEASELAAVLEKAGFSEITLKSYGVGLGQVLEWARHRVARRQNVAATVEERTAASGRYFQPHSTVVTLGCAVATAPFRVLQAPFARGDLGTGYVAFGRNHG